MTLHYRAYVDAKCYTKRIYSYLNRDLLKCLVQLLLVVAGFGHSFHTGPPGNIRRESVKCYSHSVLWVML